MNHNLSPKRVVHSKFDIVIITDLVSLQFLQLMWENQ